MSKKVEKWAKQRYQSIRKQKRMYFEKKKDFIYLHDDRYDEITNEDFSSLFH